MQNRETVAPDLLVVHSRNGADTRIASNCARPDLTHFVAPTRVDVMSGFPRRVASDAAAVGVSASMSWLTPLSRR